MAWKTRVIYITNSETGNPIHLANLYEETTLLANSGINGSISVTRAVGNTIDPAIISRLGYDSWTGALGFAVDAPSTVNIQLTPTTTPPPPPGNMTRTISITDAETGNPIQGANLYEGTTFIATSNSNGNITITKAVYATIQPATITKSGYNDWVGAIGFDPDAPPTASIQLTPLPTELLDTNLTIGAATENGGIPLNRPVSIWASLEDENGVGIPNATIYFYINNVSIGSANTNLNGVASKAHTFTQTGITIKTTYAGLSGSYNASTSEEQFTSTGMTEAVIQDIISKTGLSRSQVIAAANLGATDLIVADVSVPKIGIGLNIPSNETVALELTNGFEAEGASGVHTVKVYSRKLASVGDWWNWSDHYRYFMFVRSPLPAFLIPLIPFIIKGIFVLLFVSVVAVIVYTLTGTQQLDIAADIHADTMDVIQDIMNNPNLTTEEKERLVGLVEGLEQDALDTGGNWWDSILGIVAPIGGLAIAAIIIIYALKSGAKKKKD